RATSTIVVATAIVNMWTNDADEVAASYRRLTSRYGDRVLLGVGIGHPEANSDYRQPYVTMVDYLDRLDAGGVPPDRRILAALGPRALRLAAARTLGTHPYLVVPEHTREARGMLGPGVVIAPEQTVVIEADPNTARDIGRAFVSNPYLQLVNYTNNFRRYGYTDADLEGGGSDRLVDALVYTVHPIVSLRACAPISRPARTTSGFRCSPPTARTPCRVTGSWRAPSFEVPAAPQCDRHGEEPAPTLPERVERATTSCSDIRGRRRDLTD